MPRTPKLGDITSSFNTLEIRDSEKRDRFRIETIKDLELWTPFVNSHNDPSMPQKISILDRSPEDLEMYVEDFFLNGGNLNQWWPNVNSWWLGNERKRLEEALLNLILHWAREEKQTRKVSHQSNLSGDAQNGPVVTPKRQARRSSNANSKGSGSKVIDGYFKSSGKSPRGTTSSNQASRQSSKARSAGSTPRSAVLPSTRNAHLVLNTTQSSVEEGEIINARNIAINSTNEEETCGSIHSIPYRDEAAPLPEAYHVNDNDTDDDEISLPSPGELISSSGRHSMTGRRPARADSHTIESSPQSPPEIPSTAENSRGSGVRKRTDDDATYVPSQSQYLSGKSTLNQPPPSPPPTRHLGTRKRPRTVIEDDDETDSDALADETPAQKKRSGLGLQGMMLIEESRDDSEVAQRNDTRTTAVVPPLPSDIERAIREGAGEMNAPFDQLPRSTSTRYTVRRDDQNDRNQTGLPLNNGKQDSRHHGAQRGDDSRGVRTQENMGSPQSQVDPQSLQSSQKEYQPPSQIETETSSPSLSRSQSQSQSQSQSTSHMQSQSQSQPQQLRQQQPPYDPFLELSRQLITYFTSCKVKLIRQSNNNNNNNNNNSNNTNANPQTEFDKERLQRRAAFLEHVLADIRSRIRSVGKQRQRHRRTLEDNHGNNGDVVVDTGGGGGGGGDDDNDNDDEDTMDVTKFVYFAGLGDLV